MLDSVRAQRMSVKSTIVSEFEEVAAKQGKIIRPLSDELILSESGLDSLCFAILVARLEDKLGVDPFSATGDATFPTTFGDFVRFYENVTLTR
jgi:acyl carrier protein